MGGAASVQFVEFHAQAPSSPVGVLLLREYLPLPYELSHAGKILVVGNFPEHVVRRLESWEWEISNENVTFVSCFDDTIDYFDRGFQSLAREAMLEQALAHEQGMPELGEIGMQGQAGFPPPPRLHRLYQMLQRIVRGRAGRITEQGPEEGDSQDEG